MSKLPPEKINGKMHQPVVCDEDPLMDCMMRCVITASGTLCKGIPCRAKDRTDGLEIYYINIEGE